MQQEIDNPGKAQRISVQYAFGQVLRLAYEEDQYDEELQFAEENKVECVLHALATKQQQRHSVSEHPKGIRGRTQLDGGERAVV